MKHTILILVLILFSCNTGEGSKEAEATYYIEEAVKSRLKSPATADFPYFTDAILSTNDGHFSVTSYVDSQNGFGAVIRTKFYCEVKYDKGKDKWYLVECILY